MDKIIDTDAFESIGAITERLVNRIERGEKIWDGKPITQPGIYRNISLADYHGKRDLFDGPSVSKSSLKWLIPTHGGSPKAFWGRWKWNPKHVEPRSTKALDFGRATHSLLLGDEVFNDHFVVRPDEYPDSKTGELKPWSGNSNWCKAWLKENHRKTIVTTEDVDRIRRMRDDAAKYPLVQLGVLNGKVERTLAFKDKETGIWVKARPDNLAVDGIFVDLKTASSFDEDFLEKQAGDAVYYLQGAMVRMACRELGIPFNTFALLYVLNDDVPDTAHVELSDFELDRGERTIRWCLRTIRECLDSGEWPGARPFDGGERKLQLKKWFKERLDDFLTMEEAA